MTSAIKWTTMLLLLLLLAQPVNGQDFPSKEVVQQSGALDSEKLFLAFVKGTWHLRCNSELNSASPELVKAFNKFIFGSIYNGVKALQQINPSVIESSIKEAQGKHLIFTCLKTTAGNAGISHMSYDQWSSSPFLTDYYSQLRDDEEKLEQFDVIHIRPLARLLKALLKEKLEPTATNINDTNLNHEKMGAARNLVFHEYLHFLKLDNNGAHNSVSLIRHEAEDDSVYACAAQAFPFTPITTDLDANGLPLGDDQFRKYYGNSERACRTCAGLRLKNPDEKKLKDRCGAIKKSDFVLALDANFFDQYK